MADGLLHFQTRADALRFERSRWSGLVKEAKDRKRTLRTDAGMLVDILRHLMESGVASSRIAAVLPDLIDGISDADHRSNQILDEAHESWQCREPIDLSEHRALLTELTT
jgi:hypothetical protein